MRILGFLLLGAGLQSAAPFSHRLHLQMKLTCTGCHAAAASSTSAQDNLLPSAAVCGRCHSANIQPTRSVGPPAAPVVHFSHALHLRMGNLAPLLAQAIAHHSYLQGGASVQPFLAATNPCEACHRGLEQSDSISPAALPQMADCLVCHTVIDNPWSCETCHAKDAPLRPANHALPHFLDAHSSGKLNLDKSTCAVCHGRAFTCMGCH